MAPPPPADMPLTQRLMALAETLQFAWFCGHVTLLLCTVQYALAYITFKYYSGLAKFTYRTAFVAAAATYGIVVYKSVRARARQGRAQSGGIMALLGDENVQYLVMALVWLLAPQMPLALAPFTVYSVFHVATYTRSNLIPTIQPQPQGSKPSALSEQIGQFVKQHYDTSMTIVALLEIFLWFRILGSAILFQRGSWILLVLYTVFFRVRHSQSSFMQNAISHFSGYIDQQADNPNLPPAVKNTWNQVKGSVRQAADATDVNRMARQSGPPKKAQ